ncbi:MAG TPA: hypothetical protein VNF99_09375 [Stellaceae bacterium]|nr:hypothetical protein [Stellaceae bacterium]
MQVQNESGKISIAITDDERYLIKQCLNECCHGFRIVDFVGTIGAPKALVSGLLDQLGDATTKTSGETDVLQIARLNDDKVRVDLTTEQARIFVNCMNETERVLGPREFPSRFGAKIEEVKGLFSQIEARLT